MISYPQERRLRALTTELRQGRIPSAKTIPLVCELPGTVSEDALRDALRAFTIRHPLLSDWLVFDGDEAALERPGDGVTLQVADVENEDQFLRTEIDRRPGDTRWPLARAGLLTGARPMFYLVLDHLVADGQSIAVAHHEISILYQAALTGRPAELPPPADFAEFAARQRRQFAPGPAFDRQAAAFRRLLGDRPVEPAFAVPAGPWNASRGRYTRIELLTTAEADVFARRCRDHRVTPFMGVLAGVGAALTEMTGVAEPGMLVAIHNRETPGVAHGMGWYANMLPLYFQAAQPFTFAAAVHRVRAALLNLFEHFELPLARVADDPGGTPLFVSFTDERPSGTSPGLSGTWQRIGTAPSYRRGYGLWFALTGNGLHALAASPDSRTRGAALDAFESTLATVLRQMVAG